MSSSERLLILGATGQLGTDLVRAAAAAGVDHVGAAHEDIDVTEADSVAAGIARYRPTIVINTAALHRVDACEDDPHQAYLVTRWVRCWWRAPPPERAPAPSISAPISSSPETSRRRRTAGSRPTRRGSKKIRRIRSTSMERPRQRASRRYGLPTRAISLCECPPCSAWPRRVTRAKTSSRRCSRKRAEAGRCAS